MAEPSSSVELTAANLKGLAHPLRVQILGLLRSFGPATATRLAERLGLTSGALSYHLRQLERYGFIVEDADRGDQRDRWWRAAHESTHFEPNRLDPDAVDEGDAYERGVIEAIHQSLVRAQAARSTLPEEWRQLMIYDRIYEFDADQTAALTGELQDVLERHWAEHLERRERGEVSPDARPVAARFQVFPVAQDDPYRHSAGDE